MAGPGPMSVLDVTFLCDADTAQYVWICKGATAGSCKVPTSAAEAYTTYGITQYTGKAGKGVAVRLLGISTLVANEALAVGDNVGAEYTTAADRGKGRKIALATKPGAAAGPSNAEIDAARDYVENVQNWIRDCKGICLEAAAAQNNQCRVLLRGGPF